MDDRAPLRPSQYVISDKEWRAGSPLDKEPEIAASVARFISMFSLIEAHLPVMLARILGAPASTCEHLLSRCRNTEQRIELVDTAARATDLGNDWNKFFDECIAEMKGLQRRRNLLAHGLFSSTGNAGEMRVSGRRFDKGATSETILSLADLERDNRLAERLHLAIWKAFEGHSHERRPLR